MKHINTVCEEEKKARKAYAEVKTDEPAKASAEIEEKVRELLALRHKMDEDALAASRLKAVIMGAMKGSSCLQGESGATLATWVKGAESKTVDYEKLLKANNISQEEVAKYTTFKTGSRVFSVEEA